MPFDIKFTCPFQDIHAYKGLKIVLTWVTSASCLLTYPKSESAFFTTGLLELSHKNCVDLCCYILLLRTSGSKCSDAWLYFVSYLIHAVSHFPWQVFQASLV